MLILHLCWHRIGPGHCLPGSRPSCQRAERATAAADLSLHTLHQTSCTRPGKRQHRRRRDRRMLICSSVCAALLKVALQWMAMSRRISQRLVRAGSDLSVGSDSGRQLQASPPAPARRTAELPCRKSRTPRVKRRPKMMRRVRWAPRRGPTLSRVFYKVATVKGESRYRAFVLPAVKGE